ncbi:MAG: DUF6531 domain-containing protein [Propionibacteriaceae bacterium]|nr:DUF6531 domain-containing protein [Propionibacteriaceae bacterium]
MAVTGLSLLPERVAQAAPRAVIVLDPDDDVAQVVWPDGSAWSEFPLAYRLADEVRDRLVDGCRAEVVLTRGDTPGFVDRDDRKAVALAAEPDLMVTLAFNGYAGVPWGVETDGGPRAFARPQDVGFGQRLLDQVGSFTGRVASAGVGTAAGPPWYQEYGDLTFPWAHLEALFIDHNYDHVVIEERFDLIVDGVFAGILDQMGELGLGCSAYPPRPSADELLRLRNLGYQNYLRYGADPVSMSTGNFVTSEATFTLTGVGDQVLDLSLHYNGQSGVDSPVGVGWSFAYGSWTQSFADDSVAVSLSDGRSFLFEPDGAGGFTSPVDAFATLRWEGSDLVLGQTDGETAWFQVDEDTGRGALARTEDRRGLGVSLSYAGAGELFPRLAAVTDEAGQSVTVGTDDRGRVTALTRPDGAVWRLGYSAEGDLVSLASPEGRVLGFGYDSAHRMVSETGADGVTWLRNEYDGQSRVTRQTTSMGFVRTLLFDDSARTTTYTDAAGAVTVYHWNEARQVVKVVDALGGETRTDYTAGALTASQQDPTGAVTSYQYDADGRVTSVTDPAGGVTSYEYDQSGGLVGQTDALGQSTSYEVDSLGLPVLTTYPDGSTVAMAYDSHGDLLSETDQLGRTTSWAYDERGNMVSVTDPLGSVTAYGFDLANRMISQTDPAGAATVYAYDGDDLLLAVSYADGSAESYSYDANGQVVEQRDRRGAVTGLAYDSEMKLSRVVFPDGGTVDYAYDRESRLVAVTDQLGQVTRYELDALGRTVATTDARGGVWRTEYDAAGRVTAETDAAGFTVRRSYDAAGWLTGETAADGGVTAYSLDALGRMVAQTDPLGGLSSYAFDTLGRVVSMTDPAGAVTGQAYDAAGQLVSVTDPLGAVTRFGYDGSGRLTSETDALGAVTKHGYDQVGNRVSVTDPLGAVTSYGFDLVGNLVSETDPLGNVILHTVDPGGLVTAVTDPLGRVTRTTHDVSGRVTAVTDPAGRVTGQEWDRSGNMTALVAPDGVVTRYSYDPVGNLTQVVENFTGGPQTADSDVTTTYTYDPRGLLATVTDPNGGVVAYEHGPTGLLVGETDQLGQTTSYAYDLAGRTVSRTTPSGLVTSYTYDPVGNLTGRAYSDGTAESFAWDLAGRQTRAVNAAGTVSTSYDSLGRVTSVTDANGQSVSYSWDSVGRRTGVILPSGTRIAYGWDAAGRNTSLGTPLGLVQFAYDPAGRQVQQTRPDGTTVTTSYTLSDQVARISTVKGKTQIASFDYVYDVVGNTVSRATQVKTVKTQESYTYDALGRLTGSTGTDNNAYTWDAAGNRIGWVTGADLGNPLKRVTQANQYDLAGRLVRSVESDVDLLKTRVWTTRNSWSPDGNLIAADTTLTWVKPKTTTEKYTEHRVYQYDGENRLTLAGLADDLGNLCTARTRGKKGCPALLDLTVDPLSTGTDSPDARNTLTRTYDALGRVTVETNMTRSTQWTFDGLDPVYSVTKKDADEFWRDAWGRLVGQDTDQLCDGDWFVVDALGSVQGAQKNKLTTVYDKTTYTDWGLVRDVKLSTSTGLVFGFGGERTDTTGHGLVNYHARSYQPQVAGWQQADPYRGVLDVPQSLHRYSFVLLNPVSLRDLYGYLPWGQIVTAGLLGCGIGLVLGGLAGCVLGAGVAAGSMAGVAAHREGYSTFDSAMVGVATAMVVWEVGSIVGAMAAPTTAAVGYGQTTKPARPGVSSGTGRGGAAYQKITPAPSAGVVPKTPATIHFQGNALPGVPPGAVGTPTDNGQGLRYAIQPGTPGLDPRVSYIRIMEPTTTGKYPYPTGRATYMNEIGQTVNPLTGRTIPPTDPFAHIPL